MTRPSGVMRPILLPPMLGEPEVAVRPGRDADGPLLAVGIGILGDTPRRA